MKTKIYIGNRYHGKFTCDGRVLTRFQAFKYRVGRLLKLAIITSAAFSVASWILFLGMSINEPITVYAEKQITIEVPVREIPPVMERIAKCESGNTHYKNGQVIFNANSNGSIDRGKYQINSVWDKVAGEMGLDLTKEKDNEQFAMYLYENYGTEPWYSSKHCWKK